MKKLIAFFVILVNLIVYSTQAQTMRTTSNLNLRQSNTTNSYVLYTIPKGQTVYVQAKYGNWYYVNYAGINGFVSSSYVRPVNQTSYTNNPRGKNNYHNGHKEVVFNNNSGVRYYTNSESVRVQSPTRYNSVPVNATALCRDGTYSFSHSRRGTCSHHGGVERWY